MSGVITSSAVWAASFQRRLPESEVYVFLCILVPAVQIHQRSKAHAVHPLCHKKETWTFQYFSHIYIYIWCRQFKFTSAAKHMQFIHYVIRKKHGLFNTFPIYICLWRSNRRNDCAWNPAVRPVAILPWISCSRLPPCPGHWRSKDEVSKVARHILIRPISGPATTLYIYILYIYILYYQFEYMICMTYNIV